MNPLRNDARILGPARARRHAPVLAIAALVAIAVLLFGCAGSSDTPITTVPTPVVTAASTPAAEATPAPHLVTGLFSEPDPRPPDLAAQLEPRPVSTLQRHDLESVVLYDIQFNTVRAFGGGPLGAFSADSRYMAWQEFTSDRLAASTLHVIDLLTGEVRRLGLSRGLHYFVDERRVRVDSAEFFGVHQLVDVTTAMRESYDARLPAPVTGPSGSYSLNSGPLDLSSTFHVRDRASGNSILAFVAYRAIIISEHELVALVEAGEGLLNIFVVDIETGLASFVATTQAEPLDSPVVPIAGDEHYIVWTPSYCNSRELRDQGRSLTPNRGPSMVYDRATGTLTELTGSLLWVVDFTPDGRLVTGLIGGNTLIDLPTLTHDAVLPSGSPYINWSPDYRYATRGEPPLHGGVCPR